ncbi:hypothetical protein LRC484719_54200 [Mycobacterium riyadhense]
MQRLAGAAVVARRRVGLQAAAKQIEGTATPTATPSSAMSTTKCAPIIGRVSR